MPESRVLRYRFENNLGPRELQLPVEAKIVAAAHFNGAPALWVQVPDTEPGEAPPLEVRRFLLTTTGQSCDLEGARLVGVSLAPGHELLIFELLGEDEVGPETLEALRELNVSETLVALSERIRALENPEGENLEDVTAKIEGLGRELEVKIQRNEDRIDDVERGLDGRVRVVEQDLATRF